MRSFFDKVKDLLQMQIANFISTGLFSVFWIYMASELGPESYGEIHYFIATATLASLLFNVGASPTMGVYVAKKIKIQSTLFLISIITSVVGSISFFIMYGTFSASILVFSLVIASVAGSEILGNKLYSSYTKYHLVQKFLGVGLAFVFYLLIDFHGIIIGLAFSYLIYIKRLYDGFRLTKLDFSLLKPRFKFMSYSYILNILSSLGGTIDKLLIAPLLGFALLGNYILGFQFNALIAMFGTTVYSYIIPQYASGVSNTKLRQGTILLTAIFSIIAVFTAPVIVPILFPEYDESIEIIQILSIMAVPQIITMMYKARFFGYEKNKYVVFGNVLSLSFQIPAIIILGLTFGINGVAIAMLLSSSIGCSYTVLINKKLSKEGLFD
jgi:O-antigen/teichoic acid export membrane protein